MTEQPRRNFFLLGSVLLVAFIALLPWWRHHAYLRDVYDYGLVLAANGHMDLGMRPYVDFTTPIQAGFLGLNWLIERAGGGTYRALTLGGAGLIVATTLLLTLMLARRWAWWAAVAVGFSVAVAGASQHTILWHNSLGVFCLALASWAAACAPVWRRAMWGWHGLAAAGLFLGGLNKLNFHLVAMAAALAWAGRAGLLKHAAWGRVGATCAGILVVGLVLPVVIELAWTGASFQLWFANVVQLAAGSRMGNLRQIVSVDFLLRPIHDYYGPLPLPQVGLTGLVLSLVTLVGCWPGRGSSATAPWDRWLVPVAVAGAGAAGAALLATNLEIACLGLGAWLVLATSLWLGFAPTGHRVIFAGGFILPALVLGFAAWWAAWMGLRSQFGFSFALRTEYRPAESAGPAFASLAGLRVPPEVMQSLEVLEPSLPEADASGHRPVFYGPGLEYLGRYYPGRWEKGQPLWGHWGTSYSPADIARLGERLAREGQYQAVLATLAFDSWPASVDTVLNQYYIKGRMGPVFRHWSRRDNDSVNLSDSFDALSRLGGNVDGQFLLLDRYPLRAKRTAEGSLLFGTDHREGNVLLRMPAYRFRAVAMLARLPGSGNGPLIADFKAIIHGSTPEDARWSARIELPAGQQSVAVPFEADAGGRPLLLWVSQPAENRGGGFAGFRAMEITHAIESAAGAPRLRPGSLAEAGVTPELAASLFGAVTWRPQQMVVRGGGQPGAAGLELRAGGELWLHTDNMAGEIRGQLSRPDTAGHPPVVRVVWYKGGRLQLMQQGTVEAGQPFAFHVWTAEPGGWIGILLDQAPVAASAQVRVTSTTLAP